MAAYDALPPFLRRWLAEAALPWSPASCRRVWRAARADGNGDAETLARLDDAERATLSRDRLTRLHSATPRSHRKETP